MQGESECSQRFSEQLDGQQSEILQTADSLAGNQKRGKLHTDNLKSEKSQHPEHFSISEHPSRDEAYQELIVRLANMHAQMRDAMHHGIQGESNILMKLAETDKRDPKGKVTPSFLAQASQVTSGRISVILGNLEKKGFVVRTSDERDRRVVHVAITQEGKDEVQRLWRRVGDATYNALEHMGLEKSEQFVSLLEEFFNDFHIE